ncbi:Gnk2-homologous domain-containing protein [Cynara cardunculus var. scolymus]|uniref:Gnk2-homologous domain-containing protein n=1 Tax=Cynara cardunculus var. scolymus TaxID=59895 RepID=A0A118JSM0_CYNCS|nr:Gnk2-homologous domain-containing protein [Cynara cardunculus var. scolymus]
MVHPKFLLSLCLFTSLLVAGTTMAKTELLYAVCSSGENYTRTSSFRTNLETALSIKTTQINYGFYNFSGRPNSDRVDVIGLCRGDINSTSCRSCLHDSGENLRQQCPNQKEAIAWADECMIRYSNRSILHMNQTLPAIFLFNAKNASDPTRFNKVK